MKGKLSFMWRATLALVLVLSLGVVMATPVVADVTEPEVTIVAGEADPGLANADYTIKFDSSVALTNGVDTITIIFPEDADTGTDTVVGAITGTVEEKTITSSSFSAAQRRVSITVPADANISAGEEVNVVLTAGITNPTTAGIAYTLEVYTNQEPVAVTSATYIIGYDVANVSVTQSTTVVDTAAEYIIEFDPVTALVADTDTITITFPDDTTVPATIDKAYVSVDPDAAGYDVCEVDPTVVGRTVTVTVPGAVTAGADRKVKFVLAAAIKNPSTVETSHWKVTMYTSKDLAPVESTAYSTTAAAAAEIAKLVIKSVDSYIPNDTKSDAMTVEAQDQYGNTTNVGANTLILLSATPSGGSFYTNSTPVASVQINSGEPSATFTFKAATAGTYTITASESPVATPDWTNATAEVVVNPVLELWGGGAKIADYSTFALAIAAALPYDTIKVAASTYDEGTITINKSYLTIESTAGAATTIIDAGSSQAIAIAANNVTLGGTGKGFTIKGQATGVIVTNTGATADITIQGNIIRSAAAGEGNGIYVNEATSGMLIDGNSFYGDAPWTTNEVEGAAGNAIQVVKADASGTTPTLTVSNNTAYNIKYCFLTLRANAKTDPMESVVVTGNTVHDVRYQAVNFHMGTIDSTAHALKISQNTFYNNGNGIEIRDSTTYTVGVEFIVINYNDIYSNTNTADVGAENKGVNNENTTDVDAKYNYWGNPSGPSDATANPSGAGDAVSADVTYSPWLSAGQASVVASGKSQYATSILLSNVATLSDATYSGGWNTFSTPIWLDGSANEWGEITALVTLDYAGIYGWDGTNWTAVVASTPVTPLDAIFVQLKTEAQSLPILYYTGLLAAPTKGMSAGWELVGQANLEAQIQSDTLASIVDKYSQVIDPISGDVIAAGTNMVVGAGYWVFVTEAGTLAGFSVTPVPFIAVP